MYTYLYSPIELRTEILSYLTNTPLVTRMIACAVTFISLLQMVMDLHYYFYSDLDKSIFQF